MITCSICGVEVENKIAIRDWFYLADWLCPDCDRDTRIKGGKKLPCV